jgi:sugar/nucleoside kinase (ribokinase family)
MGGGRIFTPAGGGKSKFITKGSTYSHTRGTKIGGGVAGSTISLYLSKLGVNTTRAQQDLSSFAARAGNDAHCAG